MNLINLVYAASHSSRVAIKRQNWIIFASVKAGATWDRDLVDLLPDCLHTLKRLLVRLILLKLVFSEDKAAVLLGRGRLRPSYVSMNLIQSLFRVTLVACREAS